MNYTLPKGLFLRDRAYAVRYTVPAALREHVGKKEVVRSLGTSDRQEALKLRVPTLERIEADIQLGLPDDDTSAQGDVTRPTATVSLTAKRWLQVSAGINNATRQRYAGILRTFQEFSGNPCVRSIDRALAHRFIEHLRVTVSPKTGQPLSHRSIQAYQICLASYWRVLEHWGYVDQDRKNPFSGLLRRVAGQKRSVDPRSKTFRPITRAEAETLLRRISQSTRLKYQFEMYVAVRLMWVTGCRLNEFCSRYLKDIDDHMRITIPESKTEAGKRTVMIVDEDDCQLLRQAMTRAMVAEPAHPENVGRLFPRIRLGGYDMQSGHYLGKALEKARKNLSGTDITQWDMHSFRRNAVAALVNAVTCSPETSPL